MLSTNFDSDIGLAALDKWCRNRSYIDGFSPSQADILSFTAIKKSPAANTYPHAYRWYRHIQSYEPEFRLLPVNPTGIYDMYRAGNTARILKPDNVLNSNEVVAREVGHDLFDSDDVEEQEDPMMAAARGDRLAKYRKSKEGRTKAVPKSIFTLDIKSHGDDINMDELKARVLEIEMDGLVWGTGRFVPVGYGIQKLQINLVVEDDKVGLDELEIMIVDGLSDLVQSMDIVAMQKV